MPKHESNDPGAVSLQLDLARQAMENWLRFWQRSLSLAPWANSEQASRLAEYAQRNMSANFEFAQRLSQAKTPSDVLRIQTEFLQSQMQTISDQMKDIGTAINKTAAGPRP
jgi:hypothetical protein